MPADRTTYHQRPERLEALLQYFEQILGPLESGEIAGLALCDEPILYIMGCARSGSTLVLQYLGRSGLFTYPTNFLSRFYYAPYLGARLQEMLFGADFHGEITHGWPDAFESRLGKTIGPLAPHEFWYFWRRFFAFGDTQKLTDEAIRQADVSTFIRELRAFQTVASIPLVLKGMILNWDIPLLARLYERSCFLFVQRRVEANADSLVRARKDYFGDEQQWYSFRPPGYENVVGLDPYHQAAWQVMRTNEAIEDGLAQVPAERVFRVAYEKFCENPRSLLETISARCSRTLPQLAPGSELPIAFTIHELFRQAPADWERILESVRDEPVQGKPGGELR